MTDQASSMSKKAAVTGMAITAIAASSDWRGQAFIAGLAVVAVVVQGAIDWRRNAAKEA